MSQEKSHQIIDKVAERRLEKLLFDLTALLEVYPMLLQVNFYSINYSIDIEQLSFCLAPLSELLRFQYIYSLAYGNGWIRTQI